MSIYCKTCDHIYFKAYYPTHIKTALHKSKACIIAPLKTYTCDSCNYTHSLKDVIAFTTGKYVFFEGCTTCLSHLKLL